MRINLTRFFRVTGLVLVFVAAGLLATAVHTAHEAGWINSFQSQAIDLTWLVQPGTVTGSLLTGMLGLQPQPTVIEVARLPALRGTDGALRALAGPPPPPAPPPSRAAGSGAARRPNPA